MAKVSLIQLSANKTPGCSASSLIYTASGWNIVEAATAQVGSPQNPATRKGTIQVGVGIKVENPQTDNPITDLIAADAVLKIRNAAGKVVHTTPVVRVVNHPSTNASIPAMLFNNAGKEYIVPLNTPDQVYTWVLTFKGTVGAVTKDFKVNGDITF